MNEYELTHTPKVGPVKEPSDGMNPKHDRGLCAVVPDAQLPQLLEQPSQPDEDSCRDRDNLTKGEGNERRP